MLTASASNPKAPYNANPRSLLTILTWPLTSLISVRSMSASSPPPLETPGLVNDIASTTGSSSIRKTGIVTTGVFLNQQSQNELFVDLKGLVETEAKVGGVRGVSCALKSAGLWSSDVGRWGGLESEKLSWCTRLLFVDVGVRRCCVVLTSFVSSDTRVTVERGLAVLTAEGRSAGADGLSVGQVGSVIVGELRNCTSDALLRPDVTIPGKLGDVGPIVLPFDIVKSL